jgi:hypothetical protein
LSDGSSGLHIIVANQPRSYREALAAVLAASRPGDRVEAADPGQLEVRLAAEAGALVVCSEVSPAVSKLAGGWVQLDMDGGVVLSSLPEVEAMSRSMGLQAVLEAVARLGQALAHVM